MLSSASHCSTRSGRTSSSATDHHRPSHECARSCDGRPGDGLSLIVGAILLAITTTLLGWWRPPLRDRHLGLMHLVNAFSGQDSVSTLRQVVFAFGAGTIFYILRRVTGSLLWAMVLHGLWDFSTFGVGRGTPGPLAALSGVLEIAAIVIALVAVAFVIRGADERILRAPTLGT